MSEVHVQLNFSGTHQKIREQLGAITALLDESGEKMVAAAALYVIEMA